MTQYDDEWRGAERRPSYRRRPAPAYEAPRFDWTGVAALLILILFSAACFWYIMGAPAALPTPPAALPTAATYLQNVGAQTPHSPRSAPTTAPVEAQAQPQPQPAADVAPPAQDAAPIVEAQPVALPTIEPAQAEVIGARQSNGCAPGQVFMPRSGCHTPGSGGAMPGPVGGAK